MKALYLVRHAKSSKTIPELKDIDRPLAERGYNDAYLVAEDLKKKKIKPDLIITSPAVRAITTALIFAQQLKYPYREIKINKKIYSDNYKDVLDVIEKEKKNFEAIMLFGHNPAFEELVNYLSKQNIDQLSTSGVVCFKTDHNMDFQKNTLKIFFYIYPKALE